MLRFACFQPDELSIDPATMFLFGGQDVPVAGRVSMEQGLLTCRTERSESTGLSLQLDVDALLEGQGEGPLGVLTLGTCLLPHRERPYLLTLELARRRLMLLLTKLDEWALFDLAAGDEAMRLLEQTQRAFTRALVVQRHEGGGPGGYGEQAESLAREALVQGLRASELLARREAERLLPQRVDGSLHADAAQRYERSHGEPVPPGSPILLPDSAGVILPGRPLVGCAVEPRIFSEPLARVVAGACDFVSMPMRWCDLEPEEGTYAFGPTDRWIEWAVRTAKLPVAAGPIIDFRTSSVPEWLYIWENDHETLRELVAEHVKQVVTRYRRTVRRWTACSGLHVNRGIALSFEQMLDITRICTGIIRKLHSQGSIVLEVAEPWGEYYAEDRDSVPPQVYADAALQAGLPIDAIGLRIQMGQLRESSRTRDMMSLSVLLDHYAALEKPVLVTAMGVPSAPEGDSGGKSGHWREPWSEQSQSAWLEEAMRICIAKPFVHSVCWQTLYDTGEGQNCTTCGLITASGAAKQGMLKLAEMRRALREGRAPLSQPEFAS